VLQKVFIGCNLPSNLSRLYDASTKYSEQWMTYWKYLVLSWVVTCCLIGWDVENGWYLANEGASSKFSQVSSWQLPTLMAKRLGSRLWCSPELLRGPLHQQAWVQDPLHNNPRINILPPVFEHSIQWAFIWRDLQQTESTSTYNGQLVLVYRSTCYHSQKFTL